MIISNSNVFLLFFVIALIVYLYSIYKIKSFNSQGRLVFTIFPFIFLMIIPSVLVILLTPKVTIIESTMDYKVYNRIFNYKFDNNGKSYNTRDVQNKWNLIVNKSANTYVIKKVGYSKYRGFSDNLSYTVNKYSHFNFSEEIDYFFSDSPPDEILVKGGGGTINKYWIKVDFGK